ncbi:MAG: xanthine dehydrogenase family protein subunit M [Anaerolineales bacterium]|nr:xanthine dehydrogenase family protein subunit M [Anaerolineales bacterium]
MKPAPFKYFAPASLEEALALKAEYGEEAKALAGGQSLIPAMNFRVAQPAILVDLNRIASLRNIHKNGALTIGAMTTQSTAEKNMLVAQHVPLLHEALPSIAHPQIRNRGTIGGSVAHADPAAELPVVCLALRARMLAQSQSAERWIEAQEFFSGLFSTTLAADELLTAVEFPLVEERTGYAFLEVARRHGDYAMVGLAAVLSLDENGLCRQARLVYLNVGDGPLEATQAAASLLGQKPSAKAFEDAGKIASQEDMQPFGNLHASPQYQQHLSAVLTQRALHLALDRITQKATHL